MTNQALIERFHAACYRVVKECTDPVAHSYAQAGTEMCGTEYIRMQIPYIRSNLQYWRGPPAREVKAELDALAEEFNE
jgi:hypothetical protein